MRRPKPTGGCQAMKKNVCGKNYTSFIGCVGDVKNILMRYFVSHIYTTAGNVCSHMCFCESLCSTIAVFYTKDDVPFVFKDNSCIPAGNKFLPFCD
jgi:hypothetical protein